jgi:hypothetical protein
MRLSLQRYYVDRINYIIIYLSLVYEHSLHAIRQNYDVRLGSYMHPIISYRNLIGGIRMEGGGGGIVYMKIS